MGYRLGIDLGTTFTAAAVASGQSPTVLGLGNRSMQVPSVLFLQPDGHFLVGEAAERRGAVEPDRLAREFKRRFGDDVPMLIAGTPHSPESLTAHLLRWVVDAATEQMGEAPDDITITHPAAWGGYRHELLAQVISMADIGPTRTCPEPLAAAVEYSSHTRVSVGARIAVYDLGGGTFDVCVLEKAERGFTILGVPEGVEHLGGIDFDEALFRQVIEGLGANVRHLDLDSPEAMAGIMRLRRDCVEAKEALSKDVETVVPVALPSLNTSVRLTRPDLETLIRPALTQTINAMGRALHSAQTQPSDLHAIVLIGGSSRIPLVTQMLRSAFDTPTAIDTHPKHDVALGAVQVHHVAEEEADSGHTAQHTLGGTNRTTPPTVPATDAGGRTSPQARGLKPSTRAAGRQRHAGRYPPRGLLVGAIALLLIAAVVPTLASTPLTRNALVGAQLVVGKKPLISSERIPWDFSDEVAVRFTGDSTSITASTWVAGFQRSPTTVALTRGNGDLALPDLATFLQGPVRLRLTPNPGAGSTEVLLVPRQPWYTRAAGWLPIGLALFSLAYAESVLRSVHQRRRSRPLDVLAMAAIGLLVGVSIVSAWWGIGERLPAMPLVLLTALLTATAGALLVPLAAFRRAAPSPTPSRAR